MPDALIVNAHHPSEFSAGRRNGTLADRAAALVRSRRYKVRRDRVIGVIKNPGIDNEFARFDAHLSQHL